ncbi:Methyltransferase domain-containing protein [Mameliella alba]|uniref:class I SAM-dependent methyltransferase n=1 Tax=Mameliella alba TaxID=561184 RepID=UPI000888CDA4|nr:class I SAM-dependent methyltransferase [Mameliella alba]OWV49736.1 class I SAM-dependent methyltransferase [Mameliella alba]PTR41727.1 methyltransferase family protein [Mameliella alba]GGF53961.1 ubiquinone/menaquinone biosynthesis methyltransferase [Mameliella alba]SDC32667.1 Methyltransferase domain-containing protein [Mameliella alba]
MDWEAFFAVHKDLPREGPGSAEDVAWALELAALPEGAAICDAGAGAGGDVATLARAGRVLAVDLQEGFVAQMQARFADLPQVTVRKDDMGRIAEFAEAPFDMIWCAGALYFLGLKPGLEVMRGALKPGGALAFSEPCYFTETPSAEARAFWEDYPTRDRAGIAAAVAAAGFEILGTRDVSDAGWEAYYQPMEARIDALRPGADARLTEMLDLCAQEARDWRAVRHETGYHLVVARRLS